MNRALALVISSMLLGGCAGLSERAQSLLWDAELQKADYFSNPKDKLMVLIETVDGQVPWADCSFSMSALSDPGSHSESFTIRGPYVKILDMHEIVDNLKQELEAKNYDKWSEFDKAQLKLKFISRLPQIVYVCQPDINFGVGLSGKIYFDGKVVSSDRNPSGYGVISLRYSMPPEAMLPP